jgi:hypothetical protein
MPVSLSDSIYNSITEASDSVIVLNITEWPAESLPKLKRELSLFDITLQLSKNTQGIERLIPGILARQKWFCILEALLSTAANAELYLDWFPDRVIPPLLALPTAFPHTFQVSNRSSSY